MKASRKAYLDAARQVPSDLAGLTHGKTTNQRNFSWLIVECEGTIAGKTVVRNFCLYARRADKAYLDLLEMPFDVDGNRWHFRKLLFCTGNRDLGALLHLVAIPY